MKFAIVSLALFSSSQAAAYSEGAPWESARGEGCVACHFDAPAIEASPALSIEGLPSDIAAGAVYRLILRLSSPGLVRAGYLVSTWQDGAQAGRFTALDTRSETRGAMARSTLNGSLPASDGEVAWSFEWRAPERLDGPVMFEFWANSGNGDDSPLGDQVHHHLLSRAVEDPQTDGRRAPATGE